VLLHSISATTPDEAAFWLVRVIKQGATAGPISAGRWGR